jgi:hypothetical protein
MPTQDLAPPPTEGLDEGLSRWLTRAHKFLTDSPKTNGFTVGGVIAGIVNFNGKDGSTPTSGAAISSNVYNGWNGTAQVPTATITPRATENWSATNTGTRLQLRVVPTGTAALTEVASLDGGGLFVTRATAGIGYGTGAGGTVVQPTSKSTAVTLNTACGQITMNGAALAAGTVVTFTLTSSAIAATDVVFLNHVSGGTAGAYTLNAQPAAGSASINVRNVSAGSLSEAIVLGFVVVKAVTS